MHHRWYVNDSLVGTGVSVSFEFSEEEPHDLRLVVIEGQGVDGEHILEVEVGSEFDLCGDEQ